MHAKPIECLINGISKSTGAHIDRCSVFIGLQSARAAQGKEGNSPLLAAHGTDDFFYSVVTLHVALFRKHCPAPPVNSVTE